MESNSHWAFGTKPISENYALTVSRGWGIHSELTVDIYRNKGGGRKTRRFYKTREEVNEKYGDLFDLSKLTSLKE